MKPVEIIKTRKTRAVLRQEAKIARLKLEYEGQKKKVMDIFSLRNSGKGFGMAGLDRHLLTMEESARNTLADVLWAKICWEESRLRSSSGESLNRGAEAQEYFLNSIDHIDKNAKYSNNLKNK